MLLIDSVKYELWTPLIEDELEQMVMEHAQDIFGDNSIYFDKKQKLKSLAGVGSIPDGLVIVFGSVPQWHIVEVELSSHPLHDHIVAQVGRFISGISNPNIQRAIVNAMDKEIAKDDFIKLRLRKVIEPAEIYRFLTDLISKQPILTIIIEKDTEELREALNTLRYPQIKVVEFQTFNRAGVGLPVHAHLFEPLNKPVIQLPTIPKASPTDTIRGLKRGKRVTVRDLLDSGYMRASQTIYGWYKGKRYDANILPPTGEIELTYNGSIYDSLSAAGKSIVGHAIDGWIWWHTTRANGTECLLDELRKEYERNPSP